MSIVRVLVICVLLLAGGASAAADAINSGYPREVTDLAGRKVVLREKPERVFLAQPRHFYALVTLLDEPVERLVGWSWPLSVFDPAMSRRLEQRWPALGSVKALSRATTPNIDNEALLALEPDLVLFDLSRRAHTEGSPLAELLNALSIPYLYLDFNRHPLRDTPTSLELLGDALDVAPRAAEVRQLVARHQERIEQRLVDIEQRPSVLINVAPGLKVDCCRTNIDNGLADLVSQAGGLNIAQRLVGMSSTTLSNEWVLSHPPQLIINTAGQWTAGGGIRAGLGVSAADIDSDLQDLTGKLPGWRYLDAVRDGHTFALWHGFHQGPFAIVAMEQIAQWLYPQLFADLNPVATFAMLLNDMDISFADGQFWGALSPIPALPASPASAHP